MADDTERVARLVNCYLNQGPQNRAAICHHLVSNDIDGVLRTVLGDDGVTPKNRVWLRKWFETIKAEVEAALDKAADRAARAGGPFINYDALKPSFSDDPDEAEARANARIYLGYWVAMANYQQRSSINTSDPDAVSDLTSVIADLNFESVLVPPAAVLPASLFSSSTTEFLSIADDVRTAGNAIDHTWMTFADLERVAGALIDATAAKNRAMERLEILERAIKVETSSAKIVAREATGAASVGEASGDSWPEHAVASQALQRLFDLERASAYAGAVKQSLDDRLVEVREAVGGLDAGSSGSPQTPDAPSGVPDAFTTALLGAIDREQQQVAGWARATRWDEALDAGFDVMLDMHNPPQGDHDDPDLLTASPAGLAGAREPSPLLRIVLGPEVGCQVNSEANVVETAGISVDRDWSALCADNVRTSLRQSSWNLPEPIDVVHICDGDRAVEATDLGSAGHVHLSTPFGFHLCCARRDDQMWFTPLANGDGVEAVDASDKVFSVGAGSERLRYSSVSFRAVANGGDDSETVADDDDVADQVEADPVDYDALKNDARTFAALLGGGEIAASDPKLAVSLARRILRASRAHTRAEAGASPVSIAVSDLLMWYTDRAIAAGAVESLFGGAEGSANFVDLFAEFGLLELLRLSHQAAAEANLPLPALTAIRHATMVSSAMLGANTDDTTEAWTLNPTDLHAILTRPDLTAAVSDGKWRRLMRVFAGRGDVHALNLVPRAILDEGWDEMFAAALLARSTVLAESVVDSAGPSKQEDANVDTYLAGLAEHAQRISVLPASLVGLDGSDQSPVEYATAVRAHVTAGATSADGIALDSETVVESLDVGDPVARRLLPWLLMRDPSVVAGLMRRAARLLSNAKDETLRAVARRAVLVAVCDALQSGTEWLAAFFDAAPRAVDAIIFTEVAAGVASALDEAHSSQLAAIDLVTLTDAAESRVLPLTPLVADVFSHQPGTLTAVVAVALERLVGSLRATIAYASLSLIYTGLHNEDHRRAMLSMVAVPGRFDHPPRQLKLHDWAEADYRDRVWTVILTGDFAVETTDDFEVAARNDAIEEVLSAWNVAYVETHIAVLATISFQSRNPTPLMVAIRAHRSDLVWELLARGADPNLYGSSLPFSSGRSLALPYALETGDLDIVAMLCSVTGEDGESRVSVARCKAQVNAALSQLCDEGRDDLADAALAILAGVKDLVDLNALPDGSDFGDDNAVAYVRADAPSTSAGVVAAVTGRGLDSSSGIQSTYTFGVKLPTVLSKLVADIVPSRSVRQRVARLPVVESATDGLAVVRRLAAYEEMSRSDQGLSTVFSIHCDVNLTSVAFEMSAWPVGSFLESSGHLGDVSAHRRRARIALDITRGLAALHERGFVHGSLALDSIVLVGDARPIVGPPEFIIPSGASRPTDVANLLDLVVRMLTLNPSGDLPPIAEVVADHSDAVFAPGSMLTFVVSDLATRLGEGDDLDDEFAAAALTALRSALVAEFEVPGVPREWAKALLGRALADPAEGDAIANDPNHDARLLRFLLSHPEVDVTSISRAGRLVLDFISAVRSRDNGDGRDIFESEVVRYALARGCDIVVDSRLDVPVASSHASGSGTGADAISGVSRDNHGQGHGIYRAVVAALVPSGASRSGRVGWSLEDVPTRDWSDGSAIWDADGEVWRSYSEAVTARLHSILETHTRDNDDKVGEVLTARRSECVHAAVGHALRSGYPEVLAAHVCALVLSGVEAQGELSGHALYLVRNLIIDVVRGVTGAKVDEAVSQTSGFGWSRRSSRLAKARAALDTGTWGVEIASRIRDGLTVTLMEEVTLAALDALDAAVASDPTGPTNGNYLDVNYVNEAVLEIDLRLASVYRALIAAGATAATLSIDEGRGDFRWKIAGIESNTNGKTEVVGMLLRRYCLASLREIATLVDASRLVDTVFGELGDGTFGQDVISVLTGDVASESAIQRLVDAGHIVTLQTLVRAKIAGLQMITKAAPASNAAAMNRMRDWVTAEVHEATGAVAALVQAIGDGATLDRLHGLASQCLNLDWQTDDGQVPLVVAAELGRVDVVDLLLNRGANPNFVGLADSTDAQGVARPVVDAALIVAIGRGHADIVDRLLRDDRTDVGVVDADGRGVLELAADVLADPSEPVKMLRLLLDGEAVVPDHLVGSFYTAESLLFRLVSSKRHDAASLLLLYRSDEMDVNLGARTSTDGLGVQTPLFAAVINRLPVDFIGDLVTTYEADVDTICAPITGTTTTALMAAAGRLVESTASNFPYWSEVLDILVDGSHDPGKFSALMDANGTPLDAAVRARNAEAATWLANRGFRYSNPRAVYLDACATGSLAAFKAGLPGGNGFDTTWVDPETLNTGLHVAVHHDCLAIVKWFMENKPELVEARNLVNDTMWLAASRSGATAVLSAVIEARRTATAEKLALISKVQFEFVVGQMNRLKEAGEEVTGHEAVVEEFKKGIPTQRLWALHAGMVDSLDGAGHSNYGKDTTWLLPTDICLGLNLAATDVNGFSATRIARESGEVASLDLIVGACLAGSEPLGTAIVDKPLSDKSRPNGVVTFDDLYTEMGGKLLSLLEDAAWAGPTKEHEVLGQRPTPTEMSTMVPSVSLSDSAEEADGDGEAETADEGAAVAAVAAETTGEGQATATSATAPTDRDKDDKRLQSGFRVSRSIHLLSTFAEDNGLLMKPEDVLVDRSLAGFVNQGGFGTIWRGVYRRRLPDGRYETGTYACVIKFLKVDSNDPAAITEQVNEATLLGTVGRFGVPHLARLVGIVPVSGLGIALVIGLEAESAGRLRTVGLNVTRDNQLLMAWEVAAGLRYLHTLCIPHLDLKPDNFLFSFLGLFLVCDLGGSGDPSSPGKLHVTQKYLAESLTDDSRFPLAVTDSRSLFKVIEKNYRGLTSDPSFMAAVSDCASDDPSTWPTSHQLFWRFYCLLWTGSSDDVYDQLVSAVVGCGSGADADATLVQYLAWLADKACVKVTRSDTDAAGNSGASSGVDADEGANTIPDETTAKAAQPDSACDGDSTTAGDVLPFAPATSTDSEPGDAEEAGAGESSSITSTTALTVPPEVLARFETLPRGEFLVLAAIFGRVDVAEAILSADGGSDLSVLEWRDSIGNSALFYAAVHNHVDVLAAILGHLRTCPPALRVRAMNGTNFGKMGALHGAIGSRATKAIGMLLGAYEALAAKGHGDAVVDGLAMANVQGMTPFLLAATFCQPEILIRLIRLGAATDDENIAGIGAFDLISGGFGARGAKEAARAITAVDEVLDELGRPKLAFSTQFPLHSAAMSGSEEIVGFALEHVKSAIDEVNGEGVTPLMIAVQNGFHNVIDVLADAGAGLDREVSMAGPETDDGTKVCALELASDPAVRVHLLDLGAGKRLLIEAIGRYSTTHADADETAIRRMLDLGVGLTIEDGLAEAAGGVVDGPTLLHYAVATRDQDLLDLLLAYNDAASAALTVSRLEDGVGTPLALAVELAAAADEDEVDRRKDGHMIKRLLLAGAPPSAVHAPTRKPLLHAMLRRRDHLFLDALVAVWESLSPSPPQAPHAIARETAIKTSIVDALTEAEDGSGATPLHVAVEEEDLTAVQMICIVKPAKVSLETRNKDGQTPLAAALLADQDDLQLATTLLELGAVPDVDDGTGCPLLVRAVREDNVDKVELLVTHGASLGAQDGTSGNTALVEACVGDQVGCLEALIDGLGPDEVADLASVANKLGNTPVLVAVAHGRLACLVCLATAASAPGKLCDAVNNDGDSAVHLAIRRGVDDDDYIELAGAVLQYARGKVLDQRNVAGVSPAELAFALEDRGVVNDVFGLLFVAGLSPDVSVGGSPLVCAAAASDPPNLDLVRMALVAGADPNSVAPATVAEHDELGVDKYALIGRLCRGYIAASTEADRRDWWDIMELARTYGANAIGVPVERDGGGIIQNIAHHAAGHDTALLGLFLDTMPDRNDDNLRGDSDSAETVCWDSSSDGEGSDTGESEFDAAPGSRYGVFSRDTASLSPVSTSAHSSRSDEGSSSDSDAGEDERDHKRGPKDDPGNPDGGGAGGGGGGAGGDQGGNNEGGGGGEREDGGNNGGNHGHGRDSGNNGGGDDRGGEDNNNGGGGSSGGGNDGNNRDGDGNGGPDTTAGLVVDRNSVQEDPLVVAIRNKNYKSATLLIKAGACPDTFTSDGEPLIVFVARTRDADAAKVLLKCRTKAQGYLLKHLTATREGSHNTALIYAARSGDYPIGRMLIERLRFEPELLNDVGDEELPPLILVYEKSRRLFNLLLKRGAVGDVSDANGVPLTVRAALDNRWDVLHRMVKLYSEQFPLRPMPELDEVPDPAKVEVGDTALHIACRQGVADELERLLANWRGASDLVDMPNALGNTPPWIALRHCPPKRVVRVLDLVLPEPAMVNTLSADGRHLLVEAAFANNAEIVGLILERGGAELDVAATHLVPFIACEIGSRELLDCFLTVAPAARGAASFNVNASLTRAWAKVDPLERMTRHVGRSLIAVSYAFSGPNDGTISDDLVKLLLDHGADPNSRLQRSVDDLPVPIISTANDRAGGLSLPILIDAAIHDRGAVTGVLLENPELDLLVRLDQATAIEWAARLGNMASLEALSAVWTAEDNDETAEGATEDEDEDEDAVPSPRQVALEAAVVAAFESEEIETEERRAAVIKVLVADRQLNKEPLTSDHVPLVIAATEKEMPLVLESLLLAENANPNAVDSSRGNSALHRAVFAGNKTEPHPVLKTLLDHPRIDVNVVNKAGETSLHTAAVGGRVAAAAALLGAPGIATELRDTQLGLTPVLAAYTSPDYDPDDKDGALAGMLRVLIEGGCDGNASFDLNGIPLLERSIWDARVAVVKALIAQPSTRLNTAVGVAVHALLEWDEEPDLTVWVRAQHHADYRTRLFIILDHLLLPHHRDRAPVDLYNRDGVPLIVLAVRAGRNRIARKLAGAGADLTVADPHGRNLAHAAVEVANMKLLDHRFWIKTCLEREDVAGCTPLALAFERGADDDVAVFGRLLEVGANPNANIGGVPLVVAAVRRGSLKRLDMLVKRGADLTAVTSTGRGVLGEACGGVRLDAIELLLGARDRGRNMALDAVDGSGLTPIQRLIEGVARVATVGDSEDTTPWLTSFHALLDRGCVGAGLPGKPPSETLIETACRLRVAAAVETIARCDVSLVAVGSENLPRLLGRGKGADLACLRAMLRGGGTDALLACCGLADGEGVTATAPAESTEVVAVPVVVAIVGSGCPPAFVDMVLRTALSPDGEGQDLDPLGRDTQGNSVLHAAVAAAAAVDGVGLSQTIGVVLNAFKVANRLSGLVGLRNVDGHLALDLARAGAGDDGVDDATLAWLEDLEGSLVFDASLADPTEGESVREISNAFAALKERTRTFSSGEWSLASSTGTLETSGGGSSPPPGRRRRSGSRRRSRRKADGAGPPGGEAAVGDGDGDGSLVFPSGRPRSRTHFHSADGLDLRRKAATARRPRVKSIDYGAAAKDGGSDDDDSEALN